MSSIASAGGYKAPAGIGSRNDGGGPGSGNFYFQQGQPYEEEQPPYYYNNAMDLIGTNPFESLLYSPPTLNAIESTAMTALKSIAAQIYYKQYLKKKDAALIADEYEEEYAEAQ